MNKKTDSYNVVQELLDKTNEEIKKMPPVNILVAGKTGVGKSTLINNVFREKLADTGIGKPITKHLRKITKEGMPISLYDTRGLELDKAVQKQVKSEIFKLIEENKESKDAIHVAYYCIQASSARIEPSEEEFINELAEKMPVILVLTKAVGKPAKDFQDYLERQNLAVAFIQRVMSEPLEINEEVTIDEYGLKDLIQKTLNILPEDAHHAFLNAQQADIERKTKAARRWAARYIATTFGVGFTPIPFGDASVLVPMQVTMLAHITAIFGISLDKSSMVSIIGAIGGTGGATYAGKTIVSNAFKFIPGIGTVIGGVISGATASALTSALAYSYIEVLTFVSMNEKTGEKVSAKQIKELMQERFGKKMKLSKDEMDIDQLDYTEDSRDQEDKSGIFQKSMRAVRKMIDKRKK